MTISRPWRTFFITFAIISVVDSILIFMMAYFDVQGLIALPIFAINLPAIPVAVLYSAVGDGPISKPMVVWLFASEVLVSSFFWGYVALKGVKRMEQVQRALRGFPLDIGSEDQQSSTEEKQ